MATSLHDKSRTGYVYDERYLLHELEHLHPESPDRLRAIQRKLEATGLLKRLVPLPVLADPAPYIRLVHSSEHIESIGDIPVSGEIAKLAVAGALGGVKGVCEGAVRNAFCALRPPGHHATNTGEEEGFCYFNNIAVAARYAQEVYKIERVLIIDWDFHHGNGTEECFYEEPSVLYFSTHNQRAFPGTGSPSHRGRGAGLGYTINVHMGCGVGDLDMVRAWKESLLPAADSFKPGIVLISAGFHSRRNDPLGCFDVSDAGFALLTSMAMDIASCHAESRLVSFLEGGYNVDGEASAVAAHIETLAGQG
jgi:acetoin utilization deacetylase AcuC-like enzyme